MSDNVRPTLDDLTECWCGYQAAGVSDLMSHQLYCDPHNTAPKVIDDQRKRIAELEAQLAEVTAQNTRLTEAADWDTLNALSDEVEDYKKQLAAAQAEITRWKQLLNDEEELGVDNAASAALREAKLEAEIMGMRAEITRLREANEAWHKRVLLGGGAGQEVAAKLASLTICTGALAANAHLWREIDSQSNTASRTDVRCERCGVLGEMEDNTGFINFPTT